MPFLRFLHFADAPSIRLIGSPEIDLEEDKDALILRCVADANPPASIVWRRAGRSEIASLQVSSGPGLRAAQLLRLLVYVVSKLPPYPGTGDSAPLRAGYLSGVQQKFVIVLKSSPSATGNPAIASRRTSGRRTVHLPGAELGGHLRATVGAVGC